MRSLTSLVITALICGALAVAGCTTAPAATTAPAPAPAVTLSSLVLDHTDLPDESYILTINREKDPSEMGELAKSLGWRAGYVVEYTTTKDVPAGFQNVITQTLTTYPESSMPEIIQYIVKADKSYSDLVYTDFPAPGLGKNGMIFVGNARFPSSMVLVTVPTAPGALSAAEALKEPAYERTGGQIFAEAIFSKGTTLEVIRMTGPAPDPQVLTGIAQKAYAKIP
jgi:hypothetical protein